MHATLVCKNEILYFFNDKKSSILNSTAQALKIILEYDYMESKDDEKDEQETQDDGKTQEGCGLGMISHKK